MTENTHNQKTAEPDYLRAEKPVAILVDGGFYFKRYRHCYRDSHEHTPRQMALNLYKMCIDHVNKNERLYRILYYDCPPINKMAQNPISRESIDFSKTDVAKSRREIHEELKKLRKVALRMGHIQSDQWLFRPQTTKDLLSRKKKIEDLTGNDVTLRMEQKGVDMRIGLDIASLAHKKLVDKIILVSSDSDIVPAAKLARREGIDFILDPMWLNIGGSLFEHIDAIHSTCPIPKARHP